MSEPILVAQSNEPIFLLPKMANRHGLIAGATGTGKTVTLQTLAENFSARGVAVFMADVKGDLAGLSQAGANNPKVVERAKELKIDNFTGEACPVVFGMCSASRDIQCARRFRKWARCCSAGCSI
jgi:hypothetical protein